MHEHMAIAGAPPHRWICRREDAERSPAEFLQGRTQRGNFCCGLPAQRGIDLLE
jgi:hypothetical protein